MCHIPILQLLGTCTLFIRCTQQVSEFSLFASFTHLNMSTLFKYQSCSLPDPWHKTGGDRNAIVLVREVQVCVTWMCEGRLLLSYFVGQLCNQWCKLCSPLCNHFVAIHIQKQTVTKCSLSLSVVTVLFSALACNGKLLTLCVFHHCSLPLRLMHPWENSSLANHCCCSLSLVSFIFRKAIWQVMRFCHSIFFSVLMFMLVGGGEGGVFFVS